MFPNYQSAIGDEGASFSYNGFTGRVLDIREQPKVRLQDIDLAPEDGAHLTQENLGPRKITIQTMVEATPPSHIRGGLPESFRPLRDAYDTFLKAMSARGIFPLTLSVDPDRYINCKADRFDKPLRRNDRYWQKVRVGFRAHDPFWYDVDESALALTGTNAFTLGAARSVRPRFEVTYNAPATGFRIVFTGNGQSFTFDYTPSAGIVQVMVDCLNRTVSNNMIPTNPIQSFAGKFLEFDGDGDVVFTWLTGTPAMSTRSMFWRRRWA